MISDRGLRLWIAAAALLALATALLVAGPYAVTWEHYRFDIEQAVERLTGHEVTIEGSIDVALLPRPVLTARDVRITNQPESTLGFALTSRQIEIGFRIGPLLVGRPKVSRLNLTRPRLLFDEKTSAALRTWPPNWDIWSSAFVNPELPLITIDGGRLDLTDPNQAEKPAVNDISLTLARPSANTPLEAAGRFKTEHHRFSVTAGLGVPDSSGSSTVKLRVDAQNGIDETTSFDLNGILARQGSNAGLSGRASLAGPDLRRGLQAISSAIGHPSTFLSLGEGQAFTLRTDLKLDKTAIDASDINITLGEKFGSGSLMMGIGPKPKLDLTLDLPTVHLADETALIDFLPLDLLSALPSIPGKVEISLREAIYRGKAIRRGALTIATDRSGLPQIERARLQLPGLVDLQFSGRVRPSETGRSLNGQVSAVGSDLGATLLWLGLPLSDQRQGWRGFSFESGMDVSNVEIGLSDIDMRLDTSKVTGNADLRFSDQLHLGLDIDVERLNLDLYTSSREPGALSAFLAQRLSRLNARVDAAFRQLAWSGLHIDQGTLSATAEQRHLKLTALTLRTIGDTAMSIEGEIDLESEAVDLTAELTSAVPSRALRQLDLDLPLASARLGPIALSGWVSGELGSFDTGLKADYDDGQWLVEGRAGWRDGEPHYDLDISAEHPDYLALADQTGLAPLIPANDATGPFTLSGQLMREPNGVWTAAGSTKLGPTGITGRLTRENAGARPKWNGNVSLGNPRQDSLAPLLALAGLRAAGDWPPRSMLGRLPHLPLPTAWLDDIDGNLTLTAKGGLIGDGLSLSASLDNGFFYVDAFESSLWNGNLLAEMSIEQKRNQPLLSLAATLENVDAEALTEWLNIPRTFEAPLDLDLEISSTGQTLYDFVKDASGQLRLSARPGKLVGTEIPDFRKTFRDRTDISPAGFESIEDPLAMPLLGLTANGTLSRGIAVVEGGVVTFDPGLGSEAEASIDGSLDLLLWIAEFTLDVRTENDDIQPFKLKIVGSPERPQGLVIETR